MDIIGVLDSVDVMRLERDDEIDWLILAVDFTERDTDDDIE